MRTLVRLVTPTELVVTRFVSTTVAKALVAIELVSVDVIVLVSATELVVEKTLVGGKVIAGVPMVKTVFESEVVVVVPGTVVKLVEMMLARLVSAMLATFVPVMLATLVPVVLVAFVAVRPVELVEPEGDVPVLPLPIASTAAIAALRPFVVALTLVPSNALVPPKTRSPVRTNWTLPLMFALLLLLFRTF